MVKVLLLAAFAAVAAAKISPSVHRHLSTREAVDIVLELKESNRVALRRASLETEGINDRASRIAHVRSLLIEHSEVSQRRIMEILESGPEAFDVQVQSFFINNVVHISNANQILIEELAKLDEVSVIRLPFVAQLPVLNFEGAEANTTAVAANEWGVELIEAPSVWANGNRGEGIVVGGIDTGVIYTHNALKSNWRSTYGWFDPTDKSAAPIDSNGHGTHTMGSSVGQGGIGVAPGATWIACRGCTTNTCPEAALTGCAQWMLCPTDVKGQNPKCELAPHVINNSWGGGSAGQSWYQANVDAWQRAGIIPVFANGNAGPKCATVASPGDYKNVIGVGALGADDRLASFSSRGPSPDGRIKPDVSAPGYKVRSAWNTGDSAYNTISGTSMATPHVTGAVALYLSGKSGAKYDEVYNAFISTTDTKTLTPDNKNCGGVADAKYPNNNYGYGRINIARALGSSPTPSPSNPATTPSPGSPTTAPVTPKPPTTTAAGQCNGCKGCYSTNFDYCFPPAFNKEQCATFVDWKTIWCGN